MQAEVISYENSVVKNCVSVCDVRGAAGCVISEKQCIAFNHTQEGQKVPRLSLQVHNFE